MNGANTYRVVHHRVAPSAERELEASWRLSSANFRAMAFEELILELESGFDAARRHLSTAQ